MVRVLASHQCGPGLYLEVDAICGLSLLSVLVATSEFFAGFSGFPPSTKTRIKISKFQFDLETVDEEPLHGYATANSHLVIIYVPI